jgi:hypothetical protein
MVPLALGPSLFRSQHDELGQQVAFFLSNERPALGVAAAHHVMRASAQVTAPGAIYQYDRGCEHQTQ